MTEQQNKASHWLITINNPNGDDREQVKNLPKWVKRFKYQDEVGENGTLHIQGYIHTETVRMSAIKKWLPRAHIEICRNKDAAMKYVEKPETSVPGTQHDVKNTVEQVTMMQNLVRLCQYQPKILEHLLRQNNRPGALPKEMLTGDKLYSEEYWGCVNMILDENPDLISTYTMPQYHKAWVHCRPAILGVYRQQLENDRTAGQPDRNEIIEPPDFECPVCGEKDCSH